MADQFSWDRSINYGASPFDNSRFGPTIDAPTPAAFDNARFGGPLSTPSALAFDQGRFGPADPSANGMAGLQRGLLDQQRDNGILPSLAYTDPGLRASPAAAAIEYSAPGSGYKSPVSSAPAPMSGLLSPQEYGQVQNARSALGLSPDPAQPLAPTKEQRAFADKTSKDMTTRNAIGAVGGAILGGALLGPVGGLLGGYLGKDYAQNSFYPDAPSPPAGSTGIGQSYGDLNDYGRDVYSRDEGFRDAVDSGKVGLW